MCDCCTARTSGVSMVSILSSCPWSLTVLIDAVQRSNIESPNLLITAKPRKNVSLLAWFHHFQSNSGQAVPSIGGTPAQNASRFLGRCFWLILPPFLDLSRDGSFLPAWVQGKDGIQQHPWGDRAAWGAIFTLRAGLRVPLGYLLVHFSSFSGTCYFS